MIYDCGGPDSRNSVGSEMNDSSRDATLAQWKLLTIIAAEVAEERGVKRAGSQTAVIYP